MSGREGNFMNTDQTATEYDIEIEEVSESIAALSATDWASED